jgi:hypothetical protein
LEASLPENTPQLAWAMIMQFAPKDSAPGNRGYGMEGGLLWGEAVRFGFSPPFWPLKIWQIKVIETKKFEKPYQQIFYISKTLPEKKSHKTRMVVAFKKFY